jgi:hypothetical protein
MNDCRKPVDVPLPLIKTELPPFQQNANFVR